MNGALDHYVDADGNMFSMTADHARLMGLKRYTAPPPAPPATAATAASPDPTLAAQIATLAADLAAVKTENERLSELLETATAPKADGGDEAAKAVTGPPATKVVTSGSAENKGA